MRALVLRESGAIERCPLVIEEYPTPSPGPFEILVEVRACGVCRTDLHIIEGDLAPRARPLIPGHQVVGIVVARGKSATRFSIGERVGIAWLHSTCGSCEFCMSGQENLCDHSRYTGYHVDGGYAEFVCAHENFAYKLPEGLSDSQAAPLLCAGIIGYRALQRSRCPVPGSLALFGFGSSAHVTIQIASSRGIKVYVATRGERHRALARILGAEWVGDTFEAPPRLVDSAIIFAPAGEIVPVALRAVRKGGTVVVAGIHLSTVPAMEYESCLFHEKDLRSVEANTREDGEELLREAATIALRPTITTYPFHQANTVLQLLKSDELSGSAVLAGW